MSSCDESNNSKATPAKGRRAVLSALGLGLSVAAARNSFGKEKLNKEELLKASEQFWLPSGSESELEQALTTQSRRLKLYNTHTRHSLDVTFHRDGEFVEDALNDLNLFLRDHRANEAMQMDRMLFMQMWAIQQALETDSTFDIISGYRSPQTNEMLRKRTSGVARNSLHIQGRAIDLRLRNVKTRSVRDVARELQAGGVGYYASSDFVHIDTGEINHWG